MPAHLRSHSKIASLALRSTILSAALLTSGAAVRAQDGEKAPLNDVRLPDGFRATEFVAAPEIYSPTAVAASPKGVVYVGECPYNSGASRETAGGTVRACFDDDGDGRADRVTLFASDLHSPQGMCYADQVLYVTHAPYLSAFRDNDGDGVADERTDLIRGYGPRPEGLVHHIPSGVRLAVDGWLYSSFGDKGIRSALGLDGRSIKQIDTGGILRIRPDGSGLELVTQGQRNIYDIAISPRLDAFTRDNTNDGGGWDTRLSHILMGADYGYPRLFLHDAPQVLPPLAVLGAGGATGSLWIAEPWFPPGFSDTLFTACWTRSKVFRHELSIAASTFLALEHDFLIGTRPIDLDVDGRGALYVADWVRGGWDTSAEPAGRILRITHELAATAPAFPAFDGLSDLKLAAELEHASAVRRLEAQREFVRRGKKTAPTLRGLARGSTRLETRIAALFAVAEIEGSGAGSFLRELLGDPAVRAYALRALGDREDLQLLPPVREVARYLDDKDPHVRVEAAVALRHPSPESTPPALLAAAADGDPRLAHAAQQALRRRDAVELCLDAVRNGSLAHAMAGTRVLSDMRSAEVVVGLTNLLTRSKEDERKIAILQALAQLYHREAEWDGQWFGTRPDTSGPLLRPVAWEQSPAIEAAFHRALADSSPPVLMAAIRVAERVHLPLPSRALLAFARQGGELGNAAFQAICLQPDGDAADYLAERAATAGSSEVERQAAIEALARVGAPSGPKALMKLARALSERAQPETIHRACEAALAQLDAETQVSELLALARQAKAPSIARGALRALLRDDDPAAREASQRLWRDAELLPLVIEAAALVPLKSEEERVIEALGHTRFEVRRAAATALSKLGTARAARPLLRAAKEAALRSVALRSLASLGPCGDADLDQAIARELMLEIETTHGAADPTDFDFFHGAIAPFLASLSDVAARQAIEARLLAMSGVVMHYLVAGPIKDASKGAAPLAPEVLGDEEPVPFQVGDQEFAWVRMSSMEASGALRLHQQWKACENSTAYLYATYESAAPARVELRVGSDDQLVVWLNGAEVHRYDGDRGLVPEQDRVALDLRAGVNRLLFRVHNAGGDFALAARMVGATARLDSFAPAEIAASLPERDGASASAIAIGERIFERSCAVCHTVRSSETPRGPYLGEAAARFTREHLVQSILEPNALIAQGFATQFIEYVNEREELSEVIGFVSKESADAIEVRNASGEVLNIARGALRNRTTETLSIMPPGLVGGLTRDQFAALIAYLESLR